MRPSGLVPPDMTVGSSGTVTVYTNSAQPVRVVFPVQNASPGAVAVLVAADQLHPRLVPHGSRTSRLRAVQAGQHGHEHSPAQGRVRGKGPVRRAGEELPQLLPGGEATRAEAAAMLMRYLKVLNP